MSIRERGVLGTTVDWTVSALFGSHIIDFSGMRTQFDTVALTHLSVGVLHAKIGIKNWCWCLVIFTL